MILQTFTELGMTEEETFELGRRFMALQMGKNSEYQQTNFLAETGLTQDDFELLNSSLVTSAAQLCTAITWLATQENNYRNRFAEMDALTAYEQLDYTSLLKKI